MNLEAVVARVKALFQEVQAAPELDPDRLPPRGSSPAGSIDESLDLLQSAVQDLRLEAERLAERERELLSTLGCSRPCEIVHTVRNLQNDVVLLEAMLKKQDSLAANEG